ncbi:NAD-dependent epimerase/dehydratase [Denitrovibrio acetiphilus DSM 12809]|uniref:NAD-dependent epimerase/dehydratase n=1 Tax=Denitrovibrio acetiphilus (strain DSM 12809 / NBRC 114555 / N2460) TaxID=522772 RepID=D4H592_DENA2|nr:GDP-mannose 4,6-dehydratase [Denitrovibrio acetiphilus]ADD69448.1 NAD-dependent epimerase/dehydratase [Denitrovibrio acetiphilus DSM 12809]
MASPSKKVFITGINSFTAKHLCGELSSHGYDIYGCDINVDADEKTFNCDITKRDQVAKCLAAVQPDYIVHLGAITYVPSSDVSLIYQVNTIGTANLLEECLKYDNIKKILLPSTSNVYGNPDVEVIDETCPTLPVSHYAVSKLAMEQMATLSFGKLPIIITRPFNYTGVGQPDKFVIPKIIKHFKEKAHVIEMGTTSVIRDFSDVRFVCSSYRKLLECDAKSVAVNICTGKEHSLDELLDYARKVTGHNIEKITNPEFVRPNEIQKLIGDNSLLRKCVGELDTIDFHDTIEWMLGG